MTVEEALTTIDAAARSRVPEQGTQHSCPNCLGRDMRVLYRTGDVPVHSCLMLDDAEAARAFPRRPIELGFCPDCGVVANVVFDATMHEYADRYEDQQGYSSRFREFQSGLIRRLTDVYGVRDQSVVDIGCGKGDFLEELCREGRNRGVGIDPRCNPDLNDPTNGIEFIREAFPGRCGLLNCGLLCCRHTLEHVRCPHEFMADVRRALADSHDAIVFFEVPDATRIWRERAFWDVYYEHCSYFTPGSLARLFRDTRFAILELSRVFDEQYLTIVARPVDRGDGSRLAIEETPEQVNVWLEAFTKSVSATVMAWQSRLAEWKAAARRVAVWGAGSKCVAFLSTLGHAEWVDAVVDINPRQQGKYLPGFGKRIMPPESLRVRPVEVVIAMNPVYRNEIARQLADMGVRAELTCL